MAWKDLFKPKPGADEEVKPSHQAPEKAEASTPLQRAPEPSEEEKKTRPEPQRTRSEQIIIRLTPEELEEFNKAVFTAGKTRSDFVLDAIRGHTTVVVHGLPELLHELKKQGVNLNQMAKLANERHDTRSPEIYDAVRKNGEAVSAVMDFFSKWNVKIDARTTSRSR